MSQTEEAEITLHFENVDYEHPTYFSKPVGLLAWSWGVYNNADGRNRTFESGTQPISITKYTGPETPHLLKLAASQQTIKKLTLNSQKQPQLAIVMHDVRVTNVSLGGSGGETHLTENITFEFASVQVVLDHDGKKLSSAQILSQYKGDVK